MAPGRELGKARRENSKAPVLPSLLPPDLTQTEAFPLSKWEPVSFSPEDNWKGSILFQELRASGECSVWRGRPPSLAGVEPGLSAQLGQLVAELLARSPEGPFFAQIACGYLSALDL